MPDLAVVERDDALLASLSEADRSEFTAMTCRQTREAWRIFERAVLPGIRAADEEAMARLGRRYFLPDHPEASSEPFADPTLVVTGRQDHVVGYEDQYALMRHYPGATFAALQGAGHNVHVDRPEATAALLREWVHDLLPRT